MTVSSTTTAVSYTGNGSTTDFAVTFPFYEITVVEISAAGVVTAKTEGSHYTVAGGDGSTGTVTMLVAPASGVTLRIRRTTAKTQEADYIDGEAFPAATTEQALDRLVMIMQEIGQRISYNPTVGSQSGTIGTNAPRGRYASLNDITFFDIYVAITSIGTATGYLSVTLPAALASLAIVDEDGNVPAADGDAIFISGRVLS